MNSPDRKTWSCYHFRLYLHFWLQAIQTKGFPSKPFIVMQSSVSVTFIQRRFYQVAHLYVNFYHFHLLDHFYAVIQAYRRFQITFTNTSEASQFIDTIKPVCPCKANPQPTQVNRNLTTLPDGLLARTSTTRTIGDTAVPLESHMMQPNRTLFRPTYTHHNTSNNSLSALGKSGHPMVPTTAPRQWISNASVPPGVMDSSEDGSFVTCPEISRTINVEDQQKAIGTLSSSNPSLPNSSQPYTSSYNSGMTRNVPRPGNLSAPVATPEMPADNGKSALLASLHEIPSLYNLPRPDLERLVSQVVREEGFVRLVRRVAGTGNITFLTF